MTQGISEVQKAVSPEASQRPGRRIHSKSIEKRQRILDATARTLAENGYSNAKLSDIAKQAGTHAGALYYYFSSREDLIREVMHASVEKIADFSESILDGSPELSPLERILAFVRALVEHQAAQREDYYLRAYLRNGDHVPASIKAIIKTRRRNLRRTLIRLIKEAQDAGQISRKFDINVVSQFIIGATNWMSLWYEPGGSSSAEEIVETFDSLLLYGLLGGIADSKQQ